jgi:hypothetical protein
MLYLAVFEKPEHRIAKSVIDHESSGVLSCMKDGLQNGTARSLPSCELPEKLNISLAAIQIQHNSRALVVRSNQ